MGGSTMNMRSLMCKAGGSLSQLKLLALALTLVLLGNWTVVASAAPSYFIPTAVPTATSTLFTNGSTSISPGRVGVDKAGNVFYIGHVSGTTSTLYEIPASSPVVTVTTPTTLITGLGQYNADSAFVDAAGNLWFSNGNNAGFYEIPASNGIPNTSSLTGVALSTITAACTASSTAPCFWSSSAVATNVTGYYLQAVDIYSDGAGNVYVVDYYDNTSKGAYNRVLKFKTSAPAVGTLLVDNLASNNVAQVTVAGDGNVYYCDSVTGRSAGGLVSLVGSGALTTVGNGATSTLTIGATNGAGIEIASATGITTDPWGNLIISGKTQLDEVPLEGGVLSFADEFALLVAISGANSPMYANNAIYGGTFDVHGSYYYASYTNIMQTQVGGYNFGNVNVGTKVTTGPYLNITWDLATYLATSATSPTSSPSTLSSTYAAYLQSFPYSGTKSFSGGTPYNATTTGQSILMYFQPVHAGFLKGAHAPQGCVSSAGASCTTPPLAAGAYVSNLQGVGVGPQPMFLPGIASKAVGLSQLYTTNAHSTAATSFLPQSVAVDTYGDIFVADSANGTLDIDCLASTSSAATANTTSAPIDNGTSYCATSGYAGYTFEVTGTSFTSPVAVALDGANSAYVLDSSSSAATVTKLGYASMYPFVVVPSGATVGGTAFSNPQGITIDGYGNLYIADTGNNRIVQGRQYNAQYSQNIVYVPSTTTFGGTALSGPTGLSVDAAGDLFIADTGNGRVVEYSVTGVASVVGASGITLSRPTGVVVLGSGALIVTDSRNGLFLIGGGVGTSLSTGAISLNTAQGLSLDLAGNIYVADSNGGQVIKLNVNSPAAAPTFATTGRLQSSSVTSEVANVGNSALTFSVAPSLSDTTDFALDSSNGCTGTTSLAAVGTCNLIIDFTPSATASVTAATTGTVTLTDNLQSYTVLGGTVAWGTTGSTQTVALSGNALLSQTITFNSPGAQTIGTPVTVSATATSGLTVTFSSSTGAVCTVSGTAVTLLTSGTCTIYASQAGNSTYAPAPAVSQSFAVSAFALKPQTITFSAIASQTVGTSLTLAPTATSGLAVALTSSTASICTVSGSVATLLASGTCTLNANQAGNSIWASAATVARSFSVTPGAQTITFGTIATQTVGTPLTLSATTSAGLAVAYTSTTTSVCTVSGSTATFLASGTCTINANQAGNSNYLAATMVPQSFTVNAEPQTITFANPNTQSVGVPLTLSATATSGLTVSFTSSTTSVCAVSGTVTTFLTSGTCTINASQGGNISWAAATVLPQSFNVLGQPQTVTFGAIPTQTVGTPLALSATSTSGLAVTFSSNTTGICTVSGSVATFVTPGTCILYANQPGNSTYAAAVVVAQSFTVNSNITSTSLTSSTNSTMLGTSVTLTALLYSPAVTPTGSVNFMDGTTLIGNGPLVSGVASLSTTSLSAATHSITAIYVPNGPLLASTSSPVLVVISDFTLTGTGSYSAGGSSTGAAQTVEPGKSAIFDLNIAPTSGTAFPVASMLTVTGLPTGAIATLNTPGWTQVTGTQWTLPANTAMSSLALVISVPALTANNVPKDAPFHGLPPVVLGLLLLPLAGRMRRMGKQMGRNLTLLALLTASIVGIAGLTGCASNNGFFNQASKSYNVTVTLAAGSVSHANNLTLTVE